MVKQLHRFLHSDIIFVLLLLYTTTVDLKSNSQDVIGFLTFSFKWSGLTKVVHQLFSNYSHFIHRCPFSEAQEELGNWMTSRLIAEWVLLPCYFMTNEAYKILGVDSECWSLSLELSIWGPENMKEGKIEGGHHLAEKPTLTYQRHSKNN